MDSEPIVKNETEGGMQIIPPQTAPKRGRKPATAKPTQKAGKSVSFSLPAPSHNPVLAKLARDKFGDNLYLVKSTDKSESSPSPVFGNGALESFMLTLLDVWTNGAGKSSDGSALYVLNTHQTVLKALPLNDYDVVFKMVQSSTVKNRVPVRVMIKQVVERAEIIRTNLQLYGPSGVQRNATIKTVPTVTLK